MRLEGKSAIVTGGASGIGEATVRRFAEEGAAVLIADIDAERGQAVATECTSAGHSVSFVRTDVSKSEDIDACVKGALESNGRITTLVNNAAWMSGFKIATETLEMEWEYAMAVDLKGPFLMSKACIPHMQESSGGSVINIASVGGLVGFASYAAYCTAKGGLVQLTKSVAIDYGKDNIRANAICPGFIRTPGTAAALEEPEIEKMGRDMSVLDRLGEPIEIANAALFLASDESSFVTGTTLVVDGGWTVR